MISEAEEAGSIMAAILYIHLIKYQSVVLIFGAYCLASALTRLVAAGDGFASLSAREAWRLRWNQPDSSREGVLVATHQSDQAMQSWDQKWKKSL